MRTLRRSRTRTTVILAAAIQARFTLRMGARFEVREILRFTARRKVVIAGRVLEGIARSGQMINFNAPDGLPWSAKIALVEFVERPLSESLVGLLCEERDPREAMLYAELCPPGTVVELSDSAVT